jgi:hypothetical protein
MDLPVIITRSQWGARPYRGELRSLGAVQQVVIHHAGGYGATTRQQGARQVLALQALHQGAHYGCPDIGYHFLLDAGGHVYQGRPWFSGEQLADIPQFALGGHLPKSEAHKLGICLLGCFHTQDKACCDTPSPAALEALESLLCFLCRQYGVAPTDILTHRDLLPTTSCPGEQLYVAVGQLRHRLMHELDACH